MDEKVYGHDHGLRGYAHHSHQVSGGATDMLKTLCQSIATLKQCTGLSKNQKKAHNPDKKQGRRMTEGEARVSTALSSKGIEAISR